MAKKLTDRVEDLEAKTDALDEHLGLLSADIGKATQAAELAVEKVDDLKSWMNNGFSAAVSNLITVKLAEEQQKQWERHHEEQKLALEKQKEDNRVYGATRDRRTRLVGAVITVVGSIMTAVITALITAALVSSPAEQNAPSDSQSIRNNQAEHTAKATYY